MAKHGSETEKATALIIGTAPDTIIDGCLQALAGRVLRERIHLLLKKKRIRLSDCGYATTSFAGWLSWRSGALWLAMLKSRPTLVVIAVGNSWFHDRVLQAVMLLRLLLRFELFIGSCGVLQPVNHPSDWMAETYSPPAVAVGAAVAAGCMIVLLGWILPLPIFLGFSILVIIIELLLRTAEWLAFEHYRFLGLSALRSENITIQLQRFTSYRSQSLPLAKWCHFDPLLGWWNTPSLELEWRDRLLEIDMHRQWSTRTDSRGRRLTCEPGSETGRVLLSVFGDSCTFGYGVNDHETWPWLLQQSLPDFQVLNYACSGHSLYQNLLIMEQTLPVDRPSWVVLGFYPIGLRITNPFQRLLQVKFPNPAAVAAHGRLRRYPPTGYRQFPGSTKIASVRLLERLHHRLRFLGRAEPQLLRATIEQIMLEIQALCKRQGANLLVLCLDLPRDFEGFFNQHGFVCAHPGVDLAERQRWTYEPLDCHPLPMTQQRYAETTRLALQDWDQLKTAAVRLGATSGTLKHSWKDEIYPFF